MDNRGKIRALVYEAESLGLLFSDIVTEFFGEEVAESVHQSISQGELNEVKGGSKKVVSSWPRLDVFPVRPPHEMYLKVDQASIQLELYSQEVVYAEHC